MEEKSFKKYIILWLSQSISGLGSSMTSFALILWMYGHNHSAMSVSLMSFCNYVSYVFCSLFAGNFLFATGGLSLILLVDLASFVFALCTLLFFIRIPESMQNQTDRSPFAGIAEGFDFLKKEKGLLYMMLTMALINFCSRLTYENILSPMILERSGGDSVALGIVNACIGVGGIAGGIIVSIKSESRHKTLVMYVSAALSFLFGDFIMAISQNLYWWSVAGIAASLPIPFIMASQNTILYQRIPDGIRGRVFAVRNVVEYSTIPVGIILGGYLADHILEPFMSSGNKLVEILEIIVGNGSGNGMSVMFLCTGICGFIISMVSCFNSEIRKLN